jgi:hypothetical protein
VAMRCDFGPWAELGRAPTVISVEMRKVMAKTVPVTAMRPQIAPGGDGKPAAKGNLCKTFLVPVESPVCIL